MIPWNEGAPPREPSRLVSVYRSLDYFQVQLVRSALESAGVEVFVSGDALRAGTGEIPFLEAAPELYVPQEQLEKALQVIDALETEAAGAADLPAWRCGHCGEMVDGVFAECWKCGRPIAVPGTDPPPAASG